MSSGQPYPAPWLPACAAPYHKAEHEVLPPSPLPPEPCWQKQARRSPGPVTPAWAEAQVGFGELPAGGRGALAGPQGNAITPYKT